MRSDTLPSNLFECKFLANLENAQGPVASNFNHYLRRVERYLANSSYFYVSTKPLNMVYPRVNQGNFYNRYFNEVDLNGSRVTKYMHRCGRGEQPVYFLQTSLDSRGIDSCASIVSHLKEQEGKDPCVGLELMDYAGSGRDDWTRSWESAGWFVNELLNKDGMNDSYTLFLVSTNDNNRSAFLKLDDLRTHNRALREYNEIALAAKERITNGDYSEYARTRAESTVRPLRPIPLPPLPVSVISEEEAGMFTDSTRDRFEDFMESVKKDEIKKIYRREVELYKRDGSIDDLFASRDQILAELFLNEIDAADKGSITNKDGVVGLVLTVDMALRYYGQLNGLLNSDLSTEALVNALKRVMTEWTEEAGKLSGKS
jgi:hypothetical protein